MSSHRRSPQADASDDHEADKARTVGGPGNLAYHPRSTARQRPPQDQDGGSEPRTVLLLRTPRPLRTLRRVGDTRPLPRVTDSGLGGTRPTVIIPRRTRNGREGTEKLRMSRRARARALALLGADFLNPILVTTLALCCFAAAGLVWAGSSLDISGSPSTQPSPSVSCQSCETSPSVDVTTNANDDTTQQAAMAVSSSVTDVPTTSVRQNVTPAVVETSASPTAPPPSPHPQSDYTSPPPGDPAPSLTPGDSTSAVSAGTSPTDTGSPSDGNASGSSGTGSLTIGLSLTALDPSPTN